MICFQFLISNPFCTAFIAQKSNGVNNLPPMPLPPRSVPVVSAITEDDVARGWRVESVTTNETLSYAMPSNAVYVNNWHVHGARSSFGRNIIDFGNESIDIPDGAVYGLKKKATSPLHTFFSNVGAGNMKTNISEVYSR